jgi:hypothetical protein
MYNELACQDKIHILVARRITSIKMNHNFQIHKPDVPLDDIPLQESNGIIFMRNVMRKQRVTRKAFWSTSLVIPENCII